MCRAPESSGRRTCRTESRCAIPSANLLKNQSEVSGPSAGGGTSGTWNGDSFLRRSELSPGAVSAYANAASARNEAQDVGLNSLTFHELVTCPNSSRTESYEARIARHDLECGPSPSP